MYNTIGIRHEDKYLLERRAPLTPRHIARLVNDCQLNFIVQNSEKRIFNDEAYRKAGAMIVSDLKEADIIVGIKEIPDHVFERDKTYLFFSHVSKGQPHNMPMLSRMMDMGCTLIDYEKVTDDQGKRLIFFGRYAGLAGMINTLWTYGQRLKAEGLSTPFERIRQTHEYASLEEARSEISEVGKEIAQHGLPDAVHPLVIGFMGYGNVSQGAQEICSLLPAKEVPVSALKSTIEFKHIPSNILIKTVFREEDMVEPVIPGEEFDLYDYYRRPERYQSKFYHYLSYINILLNGAYWDAHYPRHVTKAALESLYRSGNQRLKVIGDISCDPNGSVECTYKGMEIDDPVFMYDPLTGEHASGFWGSGIAVMAVDILPSELPIEASNSFADVLVNYMRPLAETDFSVPLDQLRLPSALRHGLILYKGKLTPDFEYLKQYLP
ncbi:MAG: bifunctional lysine ketoglutarate reductase /saccharopine dehydrogenase family protein [Bacteroidota bacterium]|nr:bifunctional lysine ketoglutarate reductase /saccharopine dehydrogenase family protein [Bacteroidota bacterium]